jgi:hypothetical protein
MGDTRYLARHQDHPFDRAGRQARYDVTVEEQEDDQRRNRDQEDVHEEWMRSMHSTCSREREASTACRLQLRAP